VPKVSDIRSYYAYYIYHQDQFYPDTTRTYATALVYVLANRVPRATKTIPNVSSFAGFPYSYTFDSDTFTEDDGEPLTYSFNSTPDASSWLNFDPTTRTFNGTPEVNADVARYTISVIADDNNTNSASSKINYYINVTQNYPPMLDQGLVTPINITTYSQFIYTVPIDAFKDPEGDDYTIRVEITNGNFILNHDPLTRIITGTPTDNTKYGTHIVKFYVEDVHNITSFTHNMNIYISENLPPVVDTAPSNAACIIAHFPLSHTIPKSSFSEPDGETIIYNFATNETSKDAWLSMSETATDLVFTGTPTNTQHGNYTVTITLTDGHSDTGSTTTTFDI